MRKLWAVARTTLREAVRTRTAAVILVVLVAVVVLSPFLLRGADTLTERVQLVLNYSLSAVGFLLCILTIFLSTSTLAGDLREKRIETIATKPIRRWQIVAGKWVGVMLLNLVLVVVSGVFSYVLVRHVIGRPSLAENDKDEQRLENEVYAARHTVDPTPRDFDAMITKEIERLRAEDKMPKDLTDEQFRRRERVRIQTFFNSLPPGEARWWTMERVRPARADTQLFIRYKLLASGPGEEQPGDRSILLLWHLSPEPRWGAPGMVEILTPRPLGDFQEFKVPANVVGPDNRVYVRCQNVDERLVYAAFPAKEGIQLLYTAGTFEGNFVRTMLLLLVRLAFLSALGLAAAALLSFPVASLFVMFVFICALSVNYFVSLASPVGGTEERVLEGTGREPVYMSPPFYRLVLRAVAAAVPNFGRYGGVGDLATGKLVSWRLVVRAIVVVGAIYGGVVMAGGCLYFSTRELADVE